MRILITNHRLADRTGSELFVRELAEGLLRRGQQPICYSPQLGPLASEIRASGAAVIDSLAQLGEAPDIIHGQHHGPTIQAALHFPSVPVVQVCHGWLPEQERPVRAPNVVRYVAVDAACRERLVSENGIDPERVNVILNAVDLRRFAPRSEPLPDRPRRALLFSNYATESNLAGWLRRALAEYGIALDVAGSTAGASAEAPEQLLPQYDLVFAKARCAMEALAVGCAVILIQPGRLGPLVTDANYAELRRENFGFRCMHEPVTSALLSHRLAGYDARDAAAVAERHRAEAGWDTALDAWLDLYASLPPRIEPDAIAVGRAAGHYLHTLMPELLRYERTLHERNVLLIEREALAHERNLLRMELDARPIPPPQPPAGLRARLSRWLGRFRRPLSDE